jgi:hypothetical protein
MRLSAGATILEGACGSVVSGRSAKICMELSLPIAVPFRTCDLNQTVQFDIDLYGSGGNIKRKLNRSVLYATF